MSEPTQTLPIVQYELVEADVADLESHRAVLYDVLSAWPDDLVTLLQEIQRLFGFLPANVLKAASRVNGIPLARMYGVATFYSGFFLEPRGKIVVRVCKGTACHVGGADRIIEELESVLGISAGGTTEDLSFTLETAGCLGCCSLAPVMSVGEEMHGRLTKAQAAEVIEQSGQSGENGDNK